MQDGFIIFSRIDPDNFYERTVILHENIIFLCGGGKAQQFKLASNIVSVSFSSGYIYTLHENNTINRFKRGNKKISVYANFDSVLTKFHRNYIYTYVDNYIYAYAGRYEENLILTRKIEIMRYMRMMNNTSYESKPSQLHVGNECWVALFTDFVILYVFHTNKIHKIKFNTRKNTFTRKHILLKNIDIIKYNVLYDKNKNLFYIENTHINDNLACGLRSDNMVPMKNRKTAFLL